MARVSCAVKTREETGESRTCSGTSPVKECFEQSCLHTFKREPNDGRATSKDDVRQLQELRHEIETVALAKTHRSAHIHFCEHTGQLRGEIDDP